MLHEAWHVFQYTQGCPTIVAGAAMHRGIAVGVLDPLEMRSRAGQKLQLFRPSRALLLARRQRSNTPVYVVEDRPPRLAARLDLELLGETCKSRFQSAHG